MTASVPNRIRGLLLRARPSRDDGATAIEFLIVAVAILAIMFTAIQASMYYWARSVAAAAAQEGTDAQRVYTATTGAGQAKAYAFINSAGNTLTSARVNVASGAQQVQVTVTGQCLSVIPGFCRLFPITVTVHGTVERVTSP